MHKQMLIERAGGLAAILAAAILVIGIAGLAMGSPGLRLWLAVLFGINAAVGAVSLETLRAANPLDIAMLVLAALTFAGFWPGPGKPHKIWMGVAIALPLAGIAVLLATGLAGRSGLMGGGLVLSLLMLGSPPLRLSRPEAPPPPCGDLRGGAPLAPPSSEQDSWRGYRALRPMGFLGIVANALLLVGDFATAGPNLPLIAVAVAVGYLLLVAWFAWIAVRLLSAKPSPSILHVT